MGRGEYGPYPANCGGGGGWGETRCCVLAAFTSAANLDVGVTVSPPESSSAFFASASAAASSAFNAAARRLRVFSGVIAPISDLLGDVAMDAPSSMSSSISSSSDFLASPSLARSASILACTTCARLLTRPGAPTGDLSMMSTPPKSGWPSGGFS